MWERIRTVFESYPERLRVAEFILQNGLSIRYNRIRLNEIEIPTLKVARVAGVDRRTVNETMRTISADKDLKLLYSYIESAGPSLRGAAKEMNLGVLEITADNASRVGILANASKILAEEGISIRQALVDDPELNPHPKLTLIGNKPIPGKTIPLMLRVPGVVKVSVSQ